MSDGTSTLTFRDPNTFDPIGTTVVTLDGTPLSKLNELECVGDRVYANVLGDDNIYEIDPSNGAVTGVIDASSLNPQANTARGDVLNGIAYDPDSGALLRHGQTLVDAVRGDVRTRRLTRRRIRSRLRTMQRTLFGEEHELFRQSVRAFVESEIAPHHLDWEAAGAVPRSCSRRPGPKASCACRRPPSTAAGVSTTFAST